jgi:metal-responsive CopG/Arc/MetJ family transcriptional regulator
MRKSEPDRERLITVPSGHKLAVRLPADLLLRVEAFASKNNVDRSTAVRALLERALKGEDQSA